MTLDLAKLRAETLALIDGTTPGPWGAYGQSVKANGWCDTFDGGVLVNIARANDADQADYEGRVWGFAGLPDDNARLIAAAPTLAADTLRLLDEIERLRGALEPSVKALQAAKRELWDLQRGYWTKDDFLNHAAVQMISGALCVARTALAEGGPDDR